MDGWVGGWVGGRVSEWVGGWMDGQMGRLVDYVCEEVRKRRWRMRERERGGT
jgi:hypothetical protein